MPVMSEARLSDSPYVECIWRVEAVSDGADMVVADASWDMIITHQQGETRLTVWGPLTKANVIPHEAGSSALGIRFKPGTYLSTLPFYSQPDSGTLLPVAAGKSFWLDGAAWEYPDFDNADTFLARMARSGLLGQDAIVTAAIRGDSPDVSLRSVQRRFQRITGLTLRYMRSIERAQQAAALLTGGTSILDTVFEAGYADQQHMTRALKQLSGQTPAILAGLRNNE